MKKWKTGNQQQYFKQIQIIINKKKLKKRRSKINEPFKKQKKIQQVN